MEEAASITVMDSEEMTAGELHPDKIQWLLCACHKKKKLRGDLLTVFQYLKGNNHEDRGFPLHKEPHGEDRGQQVQVAPGEVSFWY